MATYVILSRVSPQALEDPKEFKQLAERVSAKIKNECPGVVWKESYGTLGRFDVVDIVEADSPEMVARAVMILRTSGHESTETLLATPWKEFLASL
ncbi:MAG: GYD domain-containing protein [Dehalococcoidales bacterium]|nr:GYD domain-containing protein [Dehalococcoidales bacterium]